MTTDICLEVYSEDVNAIDVDVTLYLASRIIRGRVIDASEFFEQCAKLIPKNGTPISESHRKLLTRWGKDFLALEGQRSEDVYEIGRALERGEEQKAEALRRRHHPARFIHLTEVEIIENGTSKPFHKPLRVKLENVEAWAIGR